MRNDRSSKIIPAIDIRNGRCVRLVQGDYAREKIYDGDPCEIAKRWDIPGVAIIHVVDLDGARDGSPANLKIIAKIAKSLSAKIEVGGGIRSKKDIEKVLEHGAERVVLGTVICEDPSSARDIVKEFGAERIVAGIDAKNGVVATRGWLKSANVEPIELAGKLSDAGIRRIIFTDISTDGMLGGPNIRAIRNLCAAYPHLKIISSGGISSLGDIRELFAGSPENLEAAIVGKALYEGKFALEEALAQIPRS